MTFSDLAIGDIFEYRDSGGSLKVAVKISPRECWNFDDREKALLAHNRKANKPRLQGGRMARNRAKKLCVIHNLPNGKTVGYQVIPISYVEGHKADFDIIPVDPGEMKEEVDIILRRISQIKLSLETWLKALETVILEL